MRGHRREVLRALEDTKCPASAWLDARLQASLDEIPPDAVQGLGYHPGYYWLAGRRTLPGPIGALLADLPTLKTDTSHRGADLPVTFRCVSAFPAENKKNRWHDLAALEDAPRPWHPFIAAGRFLQRPTAAELAAALDHLAASWEDGTPTSRDHRRLPWPIAACLFAAQSPQALKDLAQKAREGALGDTEEWRAAEARWRSGGSKDVDELRSPSARWPLSPGLNGSAVPLLASSLWWPFGAPEPDVSMAPLLALWKQEEPGPLRRVWADVVETELCRMASAGMELQLPFPIEDLALIWAEAPGAALQSVSPLAPWKAEPDPWAELIHATAAKHRLGLGKVQEPGVLCEWLGATFARRPALTGLLTALALLACKGVSTPLGPELLDPARFPDVRTATNARLVQLAQPWMTAERAEESLRSIAAAESETYHPLSLALAIAEKLPADNAARASILVGLWRRLPSAQWQHRESVRQAGVSALRRSSGLEDARVWDQLQMPLPRPEVTLDARRPSSRPHPRPVHIDSIRFQNLRIFADFKITPAKPASDRGQWIVLVGANGRGKTTALRGIALALVDVVSQPNRLPPRTFDKPWRRFGTPPDTEPALSVEIGGQTYRARFTYDKDRGGQQRFVQEQDVDRAAVPSVFGYGCRRGSALGGARRQIEDEPGTELYTLFDEAWDLTQAETWLLLLEKEALEEEKASDPEGPRNQEQRAVRHAFEKILGLTLLGSRGTEVFVQGKDLGEVPLAALSDGYLTMMGWVVDLLAKWIRRRRLRSEVIPDNFTETMTGLVLIDEIDLHIHPHWQKDILERVRECFPSMSFIVTTHNPFTLLGARAEEIWALRLDEQGLVRAYQGTEEPSLLTAAAIYEAYFESPRDFPHHIGADWHRYQLLAASPIRSEEEEREAHKLLGAGKTSSKRMTSTCASTSSRPSSPFARRWLAGTGSSSGLASTRQSTTFSRRRCPSSG